MVVPVPLPNFVRPIFLFAVLLAWPVFAVPATAQPAADSPREMVGKVSDSDGRPVAGAAVIWLPSETADATGTADFARISAAATAARKADDSGFLPAILGLSRITATTDSRGEFRLRWPATPDAATPRAGHIFAIAIDTSAAAHAVAFGETGPVALTVEPLAAMHVAVTDAAGKPISRAQVVVWATDWPIRARSLPALADLDAFRSPAFAEQPGHGIRTTFGTGRATIVPAAAGKFHHLYVRAPGHLPAFAPNIEIPAGKRADIDVTLRQGRAITGRVLDAAGGAVPFASIVATPMTADGQPEVTNGLHPFIQRAYADFDGNFRLAGLLPNVPIRFALLVEAVGYDAAFVPLDVAANAPVEITLSRLSSLVSAVRMPAGIALTDANAIEISADPLRAVRVPIAGGEMFSDERAGAVEFFWEDAEGRALSPTGEPDARFSRPGTGVMTMAELRRLNASADAFHRLLPDPGRPTAGVFLNRPPTPDARQRVRIVGLTDGEYEITATHADFPRVKTIPLRVRGSEIRRLPPFAFAVGTRLRVAVVDAANAPIPQAIVEVFELTPPAPNHDGVEKIATYEALSGRVDGPSVAVGRYAIAAVAPGFLPALRLIAVREDPRDLLAVTLILPAAATITGQLTRPDAGSLADAKIAVELVGHVDGSKVVDAGWPEAWRWALASVWASLAPRAMHIELDENTGRFTIRGLLPERDYTLTATAPGAFATTRAARAGSPDVAFPLDVPATIAGTLRGPNGEIIAAPEIKLVAAADGEIELPTIADWPQQPSAERIAAPTGEPHLAFDRRSARFAIAGLRPGRYSLAVADRRFGVRDVAPFDLASGAATNLAINLPSPVPVKIRVIGASRAAVANARVIAVPHPATVAARFATLAEVVATTDAAGVAAFDVPFAAGEIWAESAGAIAGVGRFDAASAREISVHLGVGGAIAGTFVGTNGAAKAGVILRAVPTQNNTYARGQEVGEIATGAAGEFVFENLASGQWAIVADQSPDAAERAALCIVEVVAGVRHLIRIADEKWLPVTGELPHAVRPGATIAVTRPGMAFVQQTAPITAAGRFELRVPAGDYIANVSTRPGVPVRLSVPENGGAATIAPFTGPTVRAKLFADDGAAIQPKNFRAIVWQLPANSDARAVTVADRVAASLAVADVSGVGGDVDLGDLPEGHYRVVVTAHTGESMAGAGHTDFTVTARLSRPVAVAMRPAGSLRVAVPSVAPSELARAELRLVAADESGSEWPLRPADAAGVSGADRGAWDWRFDGIPAGIYEFHAYVQGRGRATHAVEIRGDEVADLRVALVPGALVRAEIVDAAGHPLAGAHWQLFDATGREFVAHHASAMLALGAVSPSDARGQIEIRDVPPGEFTLKITAADGRLADCAFTVPAGNPLGAAVAVRITVAIGD